MRKSKNDGIKKKSHFINYLKKKQIVIKRTEIKFKGKIHWRVVLKIYRGMYENQGVEREKKMSITPYQRFVDHTWHP
jgi:hypothetical protein